MNAHINLDLGICTAGVVDPEDIVAFRPDYLEINSVISEVVDEYQGRVNRLSPWFGALDCVGGRSDEAIFNFSLVKARDWAWHFANQLIRLPQAQHRRRINEVDRRISGIGELILRPGPLLRLGARCIGIREEREVAVILDVLHNPRLAADAVR
ncbi:MAG: DUF5995 family protein [Nannocystaceae bacterium]